MTRTPLLLALAATAALAGCNNSDDHTIIAGPDADEANNAPASNGPVTLPPSIASSKIYRCKDNSVVYIDWLSDNKSANIRTESGGVATPVTAAEPGKPMTGPAGFSLEGAAGAHAVKIAVPGHPLQSCNV